MEQDRRITDQFQGDITEIKENVGKIVECIHGNGNPGLKTIIGKHSVYIKIMWGLILLCFSSIIGCAGYIIRGGLWQTKTSVGAVKTKARDVSVSVKKTKKDLKVSQTTLESTWAQCKHIRHCNVLKEEMNEVLEAIIFPDDCDLECRNRIIMQYKRIFG